MFRTFHHGTVQKATWLWQADQMVTNRGALVQYLTEQKVTTLYLQINPNVSMEEYRSWIKELGSRGIKVHALGGAPNWASPEPAARTEALEWLNWIERYQSTAKGSEAFAGIHVDVEPYLHNDWEHHRPEMVEAYQKLHTELGSRAKKLRLTYEADIPFWFHEIEYDNPLGQGNLADWVIHHTDASIIMAYRNQADSPGGINDIVRPLFQLAEANNRHLLIAVETTQQPEEHVSFWGLGRRFMEQQLLQVQSRYGSSPSFAGLAVHDIQGWIQLPLK